MEINKNNYWIIKPQEVILGVFFYYHSNCASNCNSCVSSCTNNCNGGCTGSCASCTNCLICTGHCNACTICFGCASGMSCSFSCNERFGSCSCVSKCYGECQYCLTGCYECNDVYSWSCALFNSSGSCQAGNGYACEGAK